MAKAIKTTQRVKKAAPVKTAPKKVAPKKAAKKKELTIKYEDKSKGQPKELITIFANIKKLIEPYEKGAMKPLGGKGGQYTLVNYKPFVTGGRQREELWFACVLVQKGYVGFYFMPPAYTEGNPADFFKPELLKCLKGKTCFHIKKDDPVLYSQIKESLKLGYDAYKKRGWL